MKTKIIEATTKQEDNWGKFLVGTFDSEWDRVRRVVPEKRFM